MEANVKGQNLIDVAIRFFQEDQWNYQIIKDHSVIRTSYRGDHGTWVCYARIDEDRKRFIFHSLMGLNIPPQFRTPVVKYLTRVNYGLPIGNFEMDIDNGEVRFKCSVETPGGELSLAMIRIIVYTSVRAMDHHFPAVFSVVQGRLSPETAIARLETGVIVKNDK